MESVIQVQILDEVVHVSLCANALGKRWNHFFLPQLGLNNRADSFFLILDKATDLEKKFWIQTNYL